MEEEINCIHLNNNFECDLGYDIDECFKGICKDRIKLDETKE